ncbi:MAG: amino acid adenylation domain-containing protein, partial [Bacteroidota bacterium]
GKTWTYQELDEQTDRLGQYLHQTYHLEADDLIGIMMERSAWVVIAMLGVLKAGAAYVPIDIEYPAERKAFIIEDTQIKALMIESESLFEVIEFKVNVFSIDIQFDEIEVANTEQVMTRRPSDLAYVIYTSGSTGQPKGVMIQHNNLVNYLTFAQQHYGQGLEVMSFPLFTSLSFDLTQTSILLTLTTGGQLSIEGGKEVHVLLEKAIQNEQVNILKLTPSHVSLLEAEQATAVGRVIVGGEPLEQAHVQRLKALNPDMRIYNEYGPTETTIGCTVLTIDQVEASISIGQPISNTQIYITDDQQNLLPVGVKGELCIAGDGVARGYLNRPELTEQKFVANPFTANSNDKMYRTGDLARWLADGRIEYLGRQDDQVKIRGYRIELGEVESVLQAAPQVDQGVVLAKADANGHKRLVAYIVPQGAFNKADIETYLQAQLPSYMVPALMMELSELPLTVNGKIDRKALPDPNASTMVQTEYVAPENAIQSELVNIWQSLLNIDKVGIHDNFFELGGDSIISIQVVSRAKRMGYQLLPKDIFEHPTILELAKVANNKTMAIKAEQAYLQGEADLLPIQQWFFEKETVDMAHFNQAVLLKVNKDVKTEWLEQAIQALVEQHDALRFQYQKTTEGWQQSYGIQKGELIVEELTDLSLENETSAITAICDRYQASLNLEAGQLIKAVLIKTPSEQNRLFIAVHHLAVDGVSWRILLDHLNRAMDKVSKGGTIELGPKSSSYRDWGTSLIQYAQHPKVEDQLSYWKSVLAKNTALPTDYDATQSVMEEVKEWKVQLDPLTTKALLQEVNTAYHTQINDV